MSLLVHKLHQRLNIDISATSSTKTMSAENWPLFTRNGCGVVLSHKVLIGGIKGTDCSPVRTSDTASRATKCEQTNFLPSKQLIYGCTQRQMSKNRNDQNQNNSQHQTKEPIIKQLHNQTNLGGTTQHDQGDASLLKANRRLICFDTNTATGTDNGVGTTTETSDTVINHRLSDWLQS